MRWPWARQRSTSSAEPVSCAVLLARVTKRLGHAPRTADELTRDERAEYDAMPRADRAVGFFAQVVRDKARACKQ